MIDNSNKNNIIPITPIDAIAPMNSFRVSDIIFL